MTTFRRFVSSLFLWCSLSSVLSLLSCSHNLYSVYVVLYHIYNSFMPLIVDIHKCACFNFKRWYIWGYTLSTYMQTFSVFFSLVFYLLIFYFSFCIRFFFSSFLMFFYFSWELKKRKRNGERIGYIGGLGGREIKASRRRYQKNNIQSERRTENFLMTFCGLTNVKYVVFIFKYEYDLGFAVHTYSHLHTARDSLDPYKYIYMLFFSVSGVFP